MPAATAHLAELERALFRVGRTVAALKVTSYAAGAPIDRAGLAALSRLSELDQVRLSDLAAALGLDVSTVSRQVRHLEDAGLVLRESDPDDRRAHRLSITAEGRQLLEQLRKARREMLCRALVGWSDADRARLTDLLARLADDLGPDLGAPVLAAHHPQENTR